MTDLMERRMALNPGDAAKYPGDISNSPKPHPLEKGLNEQPEGDENEFALGEQTAQKRDDFWNSTPEELENASRVTALRMAIKTGGGQPSESIEAQALRNLAFLKTGKFEAE